MTKHHFQWAGIALGVTVFALFLKSILNTSLTGQSWMRHNLNPEEENVGNIGVQLMSEYILPFEVIAVLLLAALVGALVLSQKREVDS